MISERIIDEGEKKLLFSDMFRIEKQDYCGTIEFYIWIRDIFLRFGTWTCLTDLDFADHDEYIDRYISKYGKWRHTGKDHTGLGMKYVWWELEEKKCFKKLYLSDSPDFRGIHSSGAHVIGDIYTCSISTDLIIALQNLYCHDLWISVFHNNLILVEFTLDLSLREYFRKIRESFKLNANAQAQDDT